MSPLHNPMLRVKSLQPEGLGDTVDILTAEEAQLIKVEFSQQNQIFLDINPNPEEGQAILRRHTADSSIARIFKRYGFVSPALMIIEDYVDFFMARYEQGHSEDDVRIGLWSEKAFHLLLQNAGLYVHYPEPVRDWRLIQPIDFYIPLLGKVEVKSVTNFRGEDRVNVTKPSKGREPDYVAALKRIQDTQFLQLVGMMPFESIKGYKGTEYDIPSGKRPFWSIPATDLTQSITPRKLYATLLTIKQQIDDIPKISLN